MTVSATARSLALVLAIMCTSGSAEAQLCAGASPFTNGNVRLGLGGGRIGAGFGSADAHGSAGVQLSAGVPGGAFASVSAAVAASTPRFIREGFAASGLDDALSSTLSVSGGYSMTSPRARNVALCPMAGFALQSGPSMWRECSPLTSGGMICSGGLTGSARALWFGGSLGRLLQVSPGFAVVPFAGAVFVSSRIAGDERSHSDGYVEMSVGAGLVVRRILIRPALSFPQGLEGGTQSLGLLFAVNMGPKRAGEP